MPLQSEIIQRLSADNSQYRSVMNQSEQVADRVGKGIMKKLDVRAGTFAIAAAIGLNINSIAEGLARFVIGFSKDTEAALNAMVEATGKAADAMEARLRQAQAAHKKALDERSALEGKQAELVADARDKYWENVKAQQKEEAQNLAEMGEENLKWYQEKDKAEKAAKAEKLKGVLEVKAAELAAAEEVARVEQARIDEKFKSLIDQWTDFEVFITSKGRGDTQLSDRELERKIGNIQSELSSAAASQLGRYQGAAGSGQSNFLTEQQRGAAGQAQTELDFRNQVRRVASTQGENAAFNQFSGLTEQRLREILQSAPGIVDAVDELKKLNAQLAKGVPTVLFGDGG